MSTISPISSFALARALLASSGAALIAVSVITCDGSDQTATVAAPERDGATAAGAEAPPLFDDRGRALASPAALVPAEIAELMRAGLYTTKHSTNGRR